MTLREKYNALLADLVEEREQFGERWAFYYDGKIAELNAAIEERFNVHVQQRDTGKIIDSPSEGSGGSDLR